jgi:hypothetical protein
MPRRRKTPFATRRIPMLTLPALLWCIAGCSRLAPTLVVAQVDAVPLPNNAYEDSIWSRAKPIEVTMRRGAGPTLQERPLQLRAIHDGRALSIMATWPDDTRAIERQAWIWDERAERYRPEHSEADQLTLLWALDPASDFDLIGGDAGNYDAWRWISGWTDLSGVAEDGRILTRLHPAQSDRAALEGVILPATRREGLVSVAWLDDPGVSGTYAAPQPEYRQKERMAGGLVRTADGSIADVKARSIYNRFPDDHPTTWFYSKGNKTPGNWLGQDAYGEQGYWLVEFHRLFTTADEERDLAFRDAGPHRFAVMLADRETGINQYLSPPLRMVFEGNRAPRPAEATAAGP